MEFASLDTRLWRHCACPLGELLDLLVAYVLEGQLDVGSRLVLEYFNAPSR
jgi:hypothetical protein